MIRTLNTRRGRGRRAQPRSQSGAAAVTSAAFPVLTKVVVEVAKGQPQDELEVDMDESGRLERDPVCGMMVGEWEHQVVHRGVGYAFCSQQCRERFSSGPGLYVGRRRSLAPKQKGMEVIKRRRMALGVPLTQARFVELKGALLSMMGVMAVRSVERMVDVGGDLQGAESATRTTICIEAVEITYDLLQATALQVERKFVELNATLSSAWGEKPLRDFIHYLEQCELDDLEMRDTKLVRCDRPTRRAGSGFQRDAGTKVEHGGRDLGG